jgi:predicted nucleic acid-binding protein
MVDVIFVDSTAWWALLDKKDKNHKKAQEIWNNFKENSLCLSLQIL